MATIRSYTTIEQSRKLAEILSLESADMYWFRDDTETPKIYPKNMMKDSVSVTLPCWSLAALLGVLPTKSQIVLAINDFQGDRKEKYVIGSVEHDNYDCYADNPVDACYEMILKLSELNLL